jgi:hypothetical protein
MVTPRIFATTHSDIHTINLAKQAANQLMTHVTLSFDVIELGIVEPWRRTEPDEWLTRCEIVASMLTSSEPGRMYSGFG